MARVNDISIMSKAKGQLMVHHVFYASLVYQTKFIIDNTIPTACTDMKKVWYNEAFIESLPVKQVMFVIVHEIMHIIFKHGLRRGHRNAMVWNCACDYAINLILKKAGFELWPMALCDLSIDGQRTVNYTGLSAEQIYDVLYKELKDSGKLKDIEVTLGDLADLKDPEAHDDVTVKAIERHIDHQVAQAWASAKMAGKMPAGLDILIENMLYPAHPWEDTLQEFMQRFVRSHEDWSRRNRRYAHIYMPSMGGQAFGELVVIADTSGSMLSKSILNRIGSEVNGAIQQMRPERTRVIWADDAECSNQDVFEEHEEIVFHPKGGGGTDMRKPLAFVEQYEPRCVLILTDCFTPWPDEPTPYPLIVGSVTDQSGPDWALTVRIDV